MGVNPGNGWSLLPVVALRHAGFPVELLEALSERDAGLEAAALREAAERAAEAGSALLEKLRGTAAPAGVGSRIGMLAALPESVPHAQEYERARAELVDRWERYETAHRDRLEAGWRYVAAEFRADAALREVLLLSNDAHFPRFAAWLDEHRDGARFGKADRRMADLLVRYLQRVTTKNETTAHFGPIATGRVVPGAAWVSWTDTGAPERRVHAAHWAAEALAEVLGRHPDLRGLVRPRRRPLAFAEAGRLALYAPTTATGFLADWRFERTADERLTERQQWLLERCDGVRQLAELRREWPFGPSADTSDGVSEGVPEAGTESGSDGGFDECLADLARRDWLVDRFEIPIGAADPLRALREALPDPGHSPAVDEAHRLVASLEQRLAEFSAAGPAERPAALAAVKEEFTAVTGLAANRRSGRHYADRAVFYEEGHSRVADLTIGDEIQRLLAEEFAPVYDLILAGPRLRMRREREILARWATDRFGAERPVPLGEFYAGYFEDRDALLASCDAVDRDLLALDDDITAALLADARPGARAIEVTPHILTALAAARPGDPAVVCNPDVLLAAASAADLAAGRLTAVLGECHAVRELLSHASYAPLLAERAPDLGPLVHEAYQRMLGPDEVLCDLVRSHPNKTGAQLLLPIPDVEITGRSGKPRGQVLQPQQLYLLVREGRIELRADGLEQRLRPLSVPAGGQSIRQDPLAPLGFPRHYGGVSLRARHRDHVPRINCGRIVLRRESWRVPATALRGARPFPGAGDSDAVDFHAVQGLRHRLGLPRHLFAKVPGEPKPLYLDLDAPLLVRQLCRAVGSAVTEVELSEMLPGPDQLWLELDGRGHTAEFRYAVFSRPEGR